MSYLQQLSLCCPFDKQLGVRLLAWLQAELGCNDEIYKWPVKQTMQHICTAAPCCKLCFFAG